MQMYEERKRNEKKVFFRLDLVYGWLAGSTCRLHFFPSSIWPIKESNLLFELKELK
jgi:hypothetical protein